MFLVNKEAVTGTWPGKGLSLKEERQTHKGATLLDDRVDDIYIIITADDDLYGQQWQRRRSSTTTVTTAVTTSSNTLTHFGTGLQCDSK